MSQTRNGRASLGPQKPFGGRWAGKDLQPVLALAGLQGGSEGQTLMLLHPQSPHTPQTAWRGQFSTHLPSSEQTWELSAHADHKTRVL